MARMLRAPRLRNAACLISLCLGHQLFHLTVQRREAAAMTDRQRWDAECPQAKKTRRYLPTAPHPYTQAGFECDQWLALYAPCQLSAQIGTQAALAHAINPSTHRDVTWQRWQRWAGARMEDVVRSLSEVQRCAAVTLLYSRCLYCCCIKVCSMQVEADIERCQEFLRLHRAAAGAAPLSLLINKAIHAHAAARAASA